MRVFILLLCLIPLLTWAGSRDKKTCASILTLEVLDDGVRPPYWHGLSLLTILEAAPNQKVIRRNGPRITVESTDVNALMEIASREVPKVIKVTNGRKKLPLFDLPVASNILDEPLTARRIALHFAMAILPQGAYWLDGPDENPATMFITIKPDQSVAIDIWPGWHLVPQYERKFQSRSLGSFANFKGVDGYNAILDGRNLVLDYSLPYGYGGDSLEFTFDDNWRLAQVTTPRLKRTFKLTQFFPLRLGN